MLVIHQLVNAITMVAPFFSWLKNRKQRGAFKNLMQIHIPVSFVYHLCSAFPRFPLKVLYFMRSVDYLCIHLSGVFAAKDLQKRKKNPLSYIVHVVILFKCVKDDVDLPFLKSAAIVFENKDVFKLDYSKASQAAAVGTCATLLYINDGKMPFGHAMFHVSLYWLYECYFDLLRKVSS